MINLKNKELPNEQTGKTLTRVFVVIMQTTSRQHLHFNPPYAACILNRLKKLE